MTDRPRHLLRESARETVVVVASILIAFSLDAWWDSAVERRQEDELLVNLLDEFRGNEPQLALRISNHERLSSGSGALAGMLQRAGPELVTVPDSLLITLLITPTFDPTLGTLEEAQNSGRTSLIQNAELRRLLSSWSGQARDVREEEQLSLQLVQREFYPSLGRLVVLADLMAEGGSWVEGTPSERLRSGSTAVPASPPLINFAAQRAQRSRRAALELADLRAHMDAIIKLLEHEVR